MKKEFYTPFFKGKRTTVMGLGVLGRGLAVTRFLAECGAILTVTDLKDEKSLDSTLKVLSEYNIRYVLGKHEISDFEKVDLVIKAAGVPLDSPYIKHAKDKNIPIAMDASLFAKLVQDVSPRITIVGITGTRGKSMTTALIYHILEKNKKYLGGEVYLGGNMRNKATLPLLEKVQPGDFVVLELDSWQCQGFCDEQISPHISVFTNLMSDHMNYYAGSMEKYLSDKANIYKFQDDNDTLITNHALLRILSEKPKGNVLMANPRDVSSIPMKIFGTHNIRNASYAYKVAEILGIKSDDIKPALESFQGLEGRLEYLGEKKSIHIINDNNATTPEATIAGIEAVREKYPDKRIIIMCGGADKGLELAELASDVDKYCAATVLLPGTGTERLSKILQKQFQETQTLKEAVDEAFAKSRKGDLILFSPGFASFGLFKNEYDRNDQFLAIINNVKETL